MCLRVFVWWQSCIKVALDEKVAHRYLTNLRDPVVKSAIQTLQLSPGSHGLDVGCGIGNHTLLLAEAVLPAGHVIGIDLSSEQIAYARKAAEESEVSKNVSFREGELKT